MAFQVKILSVFECFIQFLEQSVDRFIPGLEPAEFEYSVRRNRLRSVSLIAMIMVIFSPVAMVAEFVDKGTVTPFFLYGLFMVGLGMAGLFFVKRGGLFLKYHDYFLIVGIIIPVVTAFFTGGIFASSIFWFLALTVFTTHIGSSYHSLIICIVTFTFVLILLFGQTIGGYVPAFNFQANYFMVMRVIEFIQIMVTMSFLSILSQRQKERLLEEADRQHSLFIKEREKLFNAQKMQSLGEMAAGIAHEINNPLMIINLKCQHIGKKLIAEDPIKNAEMIKFHQEIVDLVMRISKITKGMRVFARDGSRDPMELISVNKLIEDALSFCVQRFKSSNIDINYIPHEDFNVRCQYVQIIQVIVNLLSNSFDEICELANARCLVEVVKKDDFNCAIRIWDSGKGVPESIKDKIFEPFFTTKPVAKGTGLGLSISSGIISMHHGKLSHFRQNNMTCFEIALPLNL